MTRLGRAMTLAAAAILALPADSALQGCATARAEEAANPEIPAPKRLEAETAYVAKLDAALAPLRDYTPDADDLGRVKAAAAAVKAGDLSRFVEVRAAIKDPVAAKFADWMKLRAGFGTPEEFRDFLAANPLWPERSLLRQRMEEALFTQGGSAAAILQHFEKYPPQTGVGYAALASAYLAQGNTAEAKKLASKAWREMPIPATLETGFLRRFQDLLDVADHKWRFDRMVTDDVRWADNRADRVAFARRVIPLLPEAEQKKAIARLAVFNRASNAGALIAALPKDDGSDLGLQYQRAQVLRKSGKIEEASAIILAVQPDPAKIAVLDEWWAERRELAYGALKIGKPKLAYQLVKDAGPLTVNPLKEQTFMAGWIAFRYLNDKKAAEKHFEALQAAADGPLSRAKAAYWLGRVAESRGDKAAAREDYERAAKNSDTFHGLLSMERLAPGKGTLEISPPELASQEQIARFNGLDAARAAVLARKAGLSREYTRGFLTSLRIGLPSEGEAALIAHLAEALGDTQMAVRVAKAAIAKGQNLTIYGYPLHPFPAYKPLRKPPELAFLLGIGRQETEFEMTTVSGAGAKGLLQVMTVTAKHVCRDYKIKCDIPRLLTDNRYNVTIASAYIADRMEEFDGSYVLGLAGYNAGPGRAREWIKEFGDPRDPKIDPIDWIERIPIRETREYVSKVLANIQVYRARLGEAKPLRLEQDLHRAQGDYKLPPSSSDEDDGAKDKAEPERSSTEG